MLKLGGMELSLLIPFSQAYQQGEVAILAKKDIPAMNVEGYECSFCCSLSLEKYCLVLLYNPPITSEHPSIRL